jgi:hypothetical protein
LGDIGIDDDNISSFSILGCIFTPYAVGKIIFFQHVSIIFHNVSIFYFLLLRRIPFCHKQGKQKLSMSDSAF